jgi:hypothetical protein
MGFSVRKLVCLLAAAGGLFIAVVGMFRFSFWEMASGIILYIVAGYIWERDRMKRR